MRAQLQAKVVFIYCKLINCQDPVVNISVTVPC